MKFTLLPFFLLLFLLPARAQELYFPPNNGEWETLDPSGLDWCPEKLDSLRDFLDDTHAKAFLVLKDGKIVLEWYFDQFGPDSLWYWASAGKTLTAFLAGLAQQDGSLDINDPTTDYLGSGWTDCTPSEEARITIRNQLTMTSGLDDGVPDNFCTLDTCLQCLVAPGERWAYHNAPYTLLRNVVENATGMNINTFFLFRVGTIIGATGAYFPIGYNQIFISRPRDMARFGLLILNRGKWKEREILSDTAYFRQMVNTSQDLNPSYGYLWWLNGKGSHMLPGLQVAFPTDLIPAAPDDLFAGLGANDQKVYVVPSQNLVVIRMGNSAGSPAPASSSFDNQLWERIGRLECNPSSTQFAGNPSARVKVLPNPANHQIRIRSENKPDSWQLISPQGQILKESYSKEMNIRELPAGMYVVRIRFGDAPPVLQKVIIN